MTPVEAAKELLRRRKARGGLLEYIKFVDSHFLVSGFSETVCNAIDQFIIDVQEKRRPIVVFQAPPQHGKSTIISRYLPAYLMGRFPDLKIGAASYSEDLANAMAQDVRRNLVSENHLCLFPIEKQGVPRFDVNRVGDFTNPSGRGSYLGVGVGAGLTGHGIDIGIIDDPIKNEKEALSPTIKNGMWSWYQAVFTSRLSEASGQIVMATSWSQDDLPARICAQFKNDPRLKVLRFPAINDKDEVGYNPDLPDGALVPELKSLEFLKEIKSLFSQYWWASLYQQTPIISGGNVFKEEFVNRYLIKDLPKKFDKVISSWDCAFKDSGQSDFVVGQVWGKYGPNVYLLDQIRGRFSFTRTVDKIIEQLKKWPMVREVLIEDKANGPAVIDTLKSKVSCIIPVNPDGSKLARAHAVTSYWEARNIYIPHEDCSDWVREWLSEITIFPVSANDDQVDSFTQAVRRLYPARNGLVISDAALKKLTGR
jgi:predicted phage terminase large subunit-like protein